MLDENELRSGLRALTAAPPPAPPERAFVGQRARRAVRTRRAGLALAVALTLVPVVVFGVRVARQEATPVPAPVAAWPDLRDRALDPLAEKAFADWSAFEGVSLGLGETVHWLYAGMPAGTGNTVVVAFATCTATRCSHAVLAHGDRDEIENHVDEEGMVSTSWLWEGHTLKPGDPVRPLSVYLSTGQPWADHGPETVLFVLAGPDARGVTWRAGSAAGELPESPGGVFTRRIGYVSGPVTVAVRGDRDLTWTGPVDSKSATGNARWPAAIEDTAAYKVISLGRSQPRDRDGMIWQTRSATRYAILVRCLGSSVTVTVAGRPHHVRCDGAVHTAVSMRPWPRGDLQWDIVPGDPYTTASVALAVPR